MKNKIRLKEIAWLGLLIIFIVSLFKSIMYLTVYFDPGLWDPYTVFSMLGVEPAFILAEVPAEFAGYLVFRMTGWIIIACIAFITLVYLSIRIIQFWYNYHKNKKIQIN